MSTTQIQAPKAAICVIANEVLSGKTLDTNSNYLAKFLFSRGIDLVRVSVIPDEMDVIVDTVQKFSSLVGPTGYVFTTGGIGPTHDDITYDGIANAFGVPLELHELTKNALRDYLIAGNREHDLNEDRLRMATFPKCCDVLTTSTWVPIVKMKNVYVFPGIPRLMKEMIESNVDHFKGIPIHQAIARTKILEGSIAAPLKAVAKEFPSVMIGSYVNLKEDELAFEDRSFNVQVTLYSRVEADIHAALPKAVAAIEMIQQEKLLDEDLTIDENGWTLDPLLRDSYDQFNALSIQSTFAVFPDSMSQLSDHEEQGWIAIKNHCHNSLMDIYAAMYIFWYHLLSLETFLVLFTAITTTTGYYYIGLESNSTPFGANLSWTLVTFAIVSPMIMQIRQAFTRREYALEAIAELKAITSNVLMANAIWDWGKNDRAKLPSDHAIKTKRFLVGILLDLRHLVMLPTFTRGRHQFTNAGTVEAREFMHVFHYLCRRITFTITQLHRQVEVMKLAGLPANEASRINQYHWFIQARIEKLCNVKLHRTPQATRSFTRLCILLLPFFYGPYYVYIATAGTTYHTNFAFSLTLSVMTSLLMIGIFNVEKALEDPFTEEGLDGVKVHRAVQRILDSLDVVLPDNS